MKGQTFPKLNVFNVDKLTPSNRLVHGTVTDKSILKILNNFIQKKNYIKTVPSPWKSSNVKQNISSKALYKILNQKKDIPRAKGEYSTMLIHQTDFHSDIVELLSTEVFKTHSIILSGFYLYEQNQSMMWHTNSNEPGLRLYLTYVPESKKSFFRYMDHTGEIITSYDNEGWSYRIFKPSKENPLWHCVYSDTERYSIGFRIFDNL